MQHYHLNEVHDEVAVQHIRHLTVAVTASFSLPSHTYIHDHAPC